MKVEEKEYVFVLNKEISKEEPFVLKKKNIEGSTEEGVIEEYTASLTESSSEENLNIHDIPSEINVEEDTSSLCVEEVPNTIPFLPALDASMEIKIHSGFDEALTNANAYLESRLLSYSQYQQMAVHDQNLLTPRGRAQRTEPTHFVPNLGVVDRPVTVCMGWQRVSGVDIPSQDLLRTLEEEGVSYMPHDTAYSVKYLSPVAPYGDCLFLSLEQLLLYSEECEPLPPHKIRKLATKFFYAHFSSCSQEEKKKINTTICNLYFPTLKGGWGVSPIQTRRYIALRSEKDFLMAKIYELKEQGYPYEQAAEIVYSNYARPVIDAETYCDYMAVGNGQNTHFLIGLNYSKNGLFSIDNDPENNRVAWGDDIVLEAIATAYQRDVFVVLVGCGKMFFLPHRPRSLNSNMESLMSCRSKGNAPWFLLMRLTGVDRGGDHYEPMFCERLRGDGSTEFGTIGDD